MILPIIEARNVSKVLGSGAGQVRAVKNINLTLTGGKVTVLMGPSGSGKTTLLSILGCILTPTEGSLSVAGHSTAGLSPEQLADLRRQHIGFIFQSYNLFPTLTAEENVRVALDVRGKRGSPAVMLADEPTAALDSENGLAVMQLLSEIAKDKSRAVLAVTHDPRTVPFANRVLRIEDGVIVGEERRAEGVETIHELARNRKRKANA